MKKGEFEGVAGAQHPQHPRAPSMGIDYKVKDQNGGRLHQPLAKGKGVIVRWGLEEAGGKPAT